MNRGGPTIAHRGIRRRTVRLVALSGIRELPLERKLDFRGYAHVRTAARGHFSERPVLQERASASQMTGNPFVVHRGHRSRIHARGGIVQKDRLHLFFSQMMGNRKLFGIRADIGNHGGPPARYLELVQPKAALSQLEKDSETLVRVFLFGRNTPLLLRTDIRSLRNGRGHGIVAGRRNSKKVLPGIITSTPRRTSSSFR